MNRIQKLALLSLCALALLPSCSKIQHQRSEKVQVSEDRATFKSWLRRDFAEVEAECIEKYVVIEPHKRLLLNPNQQPGHLEQHQFTMPHYYPSGVPRIDFMVHVGSLLPKGEKPVVSYVQLSRVHESTTSFEVLDLYTIPKVLKDMLKKDVLEVEFSIMLWFDEEDLSTEPYMPTDPEGKDIFKGYNFNHMNICGGRKDYAALNAGFNKMLAVMYFRGGPERVKKAEIALFAQSRLDGQPLPIAKGETAPVDQIVFEQRFLREGAAEEPGYQRTRIIARATSAQGE